MTRERVLLHQPPGCFPTYRERLALEAIELARPYRARICLDGLGSMIICGDTREDVTSRGPRPRPGPNGPIDCLVWVRHPTQGEAGER
jgi:hypothetical protein